MPGRFRIHTFDTSKIVGTSDTLGAAVGVSDTSITLTSGAATVNGSQFMVGTEQILILSGGGTATLQVLRGHAGTTPAAYASGAAVSVAGALTFTLLPVSSCPNQAFTFAKKSTDIHYVKLMPYQGQTTPVVIPADIFPNGEAAIILGDVSSSVGTAQLTAPGIGNSWISTQVYTAQLAAVVSSVASGGAAPGDVTAITVTGFIDPISAAVTLSVGVTPPSPIGGFIGCHIFLEAPDQSATTPFIIGSSALGGTDAVSGPWVPIDCGDQPYVASQQPWTITVPAPPGVDPTQNTPCRIYAVAFSTSGEKQLVQANQAGASPNQAFTLVSLDSGTPTSGTNVTGLTVASGAQVGIVATVLAPVNVTGKLQTPVEVIVTDTPTTKGWAFELVLTYAGQDPTILANQFVLSGIETQAGPVQAGSDGISVPHSFALDTPTTVTQATVWLIAGLVDSSGNFQGNNLVPGITPSFPITFGSTIGTTDASAIMAATIAASMAVINGLFGVAPAGITNPLLGTVAVATINIQALAVGTPQIQSVAITNALIANLAVSSSQIQNATITGAQIASATIAGANIGLATIAQANLANLSVGTAQIQNLAVTDAKINDLSASKITAGTITATISVTAGTFTGSTLTLNANSMITAINNTALGSSAPFGLSVKSTSWPTSGGASGLSDNGLECYNQNALCVQLAIAGGAGALELFDSSTSDSVFVFANNGSGPGVSINGTQVISTRVATTPVTLADVIAVLQHHGLSS